MATATTLGTYKSTRTRVALATPSSRFKRLATSSPRFFRGIPTYLQIIMKLHDIDSKQIVIVDKIREDLLGINILGSEFFYLIKNPLFGVVKYKNDQRTSYGMYLFFVKELVRLFKFLICRLCGRLFLKETPVLTGNFIFTIDLPRAKDINFQERILANFDINKINILTDSHLVEKKLNNNNARKLYKSYLMINRVGLSYKDYLLWFKITSKVRRIGILCLPYIAMPILQSILYIRLYESVLNPLKTKAIITYSDNQMHEYAITLVASKKGISTYTNQHGLIGYVTEPVISSKIFVWGDVFRKQLCEMGVADNKIVTVGRVGQPGTISHQNNVTCNNSKLLFDVYKFDSDRLTVAYFATDYGPDENVELFKVVCSVLSLPINIIIRPRPWANKKTFNQYSSWLRNYNGEVKANVVISNDEDFNEVFERIDVLVTCHSGAILDAMLYSVVGIILDLFDHMHLRENLPYYQDAIISHDANSFYLTIQNFILDRNKLFRLRVETFNNSKKYFEITPGYTPEEKIADFILNDCVDSK